MNKNEIKALVNPHILKLSAYTSARSEFKGQADIFLDANENNFRKAYNRYPDPLQGALKDQIALLKPVQQQQIFVGNGSDEAIDLLIRIFCRTGQDKIVCMPPTYGMYQVAASIADVEVQSIPLDADYQPDVDRVLDEQDEQTKILFICSPNNPTGNDIELSKILRLVEGFRGIVVVDEAYIDFSEQLSLLNFLDLYPNLVILQTLSKAWALAAARVGMAFAQAEIIALLNKIKPPYNLSKPAQNIAIARLQELEQFKHDVLLTVAERNRMSKALSSIDCVLNIYPSQANFILVQVTEPKQIYEHLMQQGIIVRNRSSVEGCHQCLRFTVGTPTENNQLIYALSNFLKSTNYEKKSFISGSRWDYSH